MRNFAVVKPDGTVAYVISLNVGDPEKHLPDIQQGFNLFEVDAAFNAANSLIIDGHVIEVEPKPDPHVKQQAVERRDRILAQTDWTQMPDVPLTKVKKAEWKLYRQQLRDLPQTGGFPECAWPSPPPP